VAPSDNDDLELLTDAAGEAGALALRFFRRDPKAWQKGASSIVSEADIEVDRLLKSMLHGARPDYGWLSEETADNPDSMSASRVFVVDPIDGTRAFLAGDREWTVSLAVVEAERPISAVLFAPALGEMFRATASGGAERDGEVIKVSEAASLAGARVAGPPRAARRIAAAAGVSAGEARIVPSLAYRLSLVAAGEVDVGLARPNAHEWDLAAADLLVHEAGGRLTDPGGAKLRYNQPNLRQPWVIATTPLLCEEVVRLVAGIEREDKGKDEEP
jgi:myo-inositol-1(or 4)-monophosphatase